MGKSKKLMELNGSFEEIFLLIDVLAETRDEFKKLDLPQEMIDSIKESNTEFNVTLAEEDNCVKYRMECSMPF